MDTISLSEDSQQVGGATFQQDGNFDRSRQKIEDHIAMCLAGSAAEEISYGARSPGSGGTDGSDLQRATILSLKLEASYGLGGGLSYRASTDEAELLNVLSTDTDLRARVDRTLAKQFLRAETILQKRIDALESLAAALLEKLKLSPHDVADILKPHFKVNR